MATDPLACDCREAVAYARSLGPSATVVCDGCGARVAATKGGQTRARKAREQDDERARRRAEHHALVDLASCARWRARASVRGHESPTPYGEQTAAPVAWWRLPAPPKGTTVGERPDDGSAEQDRARGREVDARLRWLEWAARREPALEEPVRVLVYLCERMGRGRLEEGAASVAELVGRAFAEPAQLAVWMASGDVVARATLLGRVLLAGALTAWEEAPSAAAYELKASG